MRNGAPVNGSRRSGSGWPSRAAMPMRIWRQWVSRRQLRGSFRAVLSSACDEKWVAFGRCCTAAVKSSHRAARARPVAAAGSRRCRCTNTDSNASRWRAAGSKPNSQATSSSRAPQSAIVTWPSSSKITWLAIAAAASAGRSRRASSTARPALSGAAADCGSAAIVASVQTRSPRLSQSSTSSANVIASSHNATAPRASPSCSRRTKSDRR